MTTPTFTTYGFRAQRKGEDAESYRRALIAHVEDRDFAAAHEIRVGRLQAEWTPDDVAAFVRRTLATPAPRTEFPTPRVFEMAEAFRVERVNEETLIRLATALLAVVVQNRIDAPTASLAIFANVLLRDGRVLMTTCDRGDRVALLRNLARAEPVYGFFLVFDAFIHSINPRAATAAATKRDAILAQIGTRDRRLMKVRPYHVADGVAVFDEPPPDIDPRAGEWTVDGDPYASVFAAAPPAAGASS